MRKAISGVLVLTAAWAASTMVGCSQDDPADDTGGTGGTATSGGTAGTATSGGAGGTTGGTGGSTGGAGGTTGGAAGSGTGGTTGGTTTSGGTGSGGTNTGGAAGTATAGGSSGAGGDGMSGSGGSAGSATAGSGGEATGGSAGSGGSSGGGSGGTGFVTCPYTPPADPTGTSAGEITLFNNNGAWTWYNDERVIVDKEKGKIIVGSDANAQGANGGGRDGAVEVVIYDVATKTAGPVKILGDLAPDDHNNAAFLIKPDGNYLAFWAGHNEDCNSYWSNHDGTNWASGKSFSWTNLGCPFTVNGNQRRITYNNLWNMTDENKIYNFVRSIGTSPNILVSSDNGMTWSHAGRVSSTPPVGYVAGYYKYWGNQKDRIDFLATEAHPRDFDNSLYHGYIKGGKSYDSDDVEVDGNIGDMNAPEVTEFTQIFRTGTSIGGETFNRMWNSDIVRYDDGTIAAIGHGRTEMDNNDPTHSFVYMRFDGSTWKTTYLGKAGLKLYGDEQDYVGLGAVHPNDPRIIYISSPFDPRTGAARPNNRREIFMGVTCDAGATFQWTPITWNSPQDNIRPVVPAWDDKNMVLAWFRGTYQTAQIYDEEVVGIITQLP